MNYGITCGTYVLTTIPNNPHPIVAPKNPPIDPSIVFLGLTFGQSLCLPKNLTKIISYCIRKP